MILTDEAVASKGTWRWPSGLEQPLGEFQGVTWYAARTPDPDKRKCAVLDDQTGTLMDIQCGAQSARPFICFSTNPECAENE